MALQEGHGEAPQPAQVVAQGPLAGATVVLAEVHVQDPVHRLDPPVAADRLAEPLAAEIAGAEVVPHLVRLRAVAMTRDPHGVADRLHTRPVLRRPESMRHLREIIRTFVDAAASLVERLVAAVAEVLQVAL